MDVLNKDLVESNQDKDLFPYIQRAALDMILETAMGVSMGIQVQRQSEYADCIERTVHVMFQRSNVPWYMHDLTFNLFPVKNVYYQDLKTLHAFTRKVIKDRKKLLDEEDGRCAAEVNTKTPFLDLLLRLQFDGGQRLSDQDIEAEVDTFMFEGHDTTTCALSWALFLIGNHPEVHTTFYVCLNPKAILQNSNRYKVVQYLNVIF